MALLVLDPQSPVPPYEQVRSQIAAAIESGGLRPAAQLPTVRRLAGDLGIAVNTVARAYRELELAGLVEPRGRQGTFVAAPRHRHGSWPSRPRGRSCGGCASWALTAPRPWPSSAMRRRAPASRPGCRSHERAPVRWPSDRVSRRVRHHRGHHGA